MLMGIFISIHDQVDKLKVLNIITNANCHFSNSPAAAPKCTVVPAFNGHFCIQAKVSLHGRCPLIGGTGMLV